ncbi:MAG: GntR family transcriptional regulator [Hyphomicrobiaceae bacterium]
MVELTRSPVPLYFQIASDLERQIKSGALRPDEQLPNEKDLAARYGVSLVTVRGAMRLLLDNGVIVRYAGKGTFVAKREARKSIWSIGSLDDLVATGLKSTMRMISQERLEPPSWALERLGLPLGAKAHMVRALREAQGEAFMVTDQFHPLDLARGLRKADFARPEARSRLVVQIVAAHCNLTIGSVRQTMSAENASGEIAAILGVQAGDPLLVVERDFFSDAGRIIQTGKAYYRTDHHRYMITISLLEKPPGRPGFQFPAQHQLDPQDQN